MLQEGRRSYTCQNPAFDSSKWTLALGHMCRLDSNLLFHHICPTLVVYREGGQGCRDKRRLDRRDKAKYRGSKHKTLSKKAYRVGQEGAKKQAKKPGNT